MDNTNNRHSCIFGLCVRQNAVGLPKVFENIKRLNSLFDKQLVVAYYDYSIDGSLEVMKELSCKYDIQLVVLNEDCSRKPGTVRTVNIATARNAILDYVFDNRTGQDYDLFAMMDSNDYSCQQNIIPDIVHKYLQPDKMENWDGLSFARVSYYDLWAFSKDECQLGCWSYPRLHTRNTAPLDMYQDAVRSKINTTILARENVGKLIEVQSAFAGFAIYKKNKFVGCRYDGVFKRDWFDDKLLALNVRMFPIATLGRIDECEHRVFHMMAAKKNNARIMVGCDQVFEVEEKYKHLIPS